MFLRRKFVDPLHAGADPIPPVSGREDPIAAERRDIAHNLKMVLGTRRGTGYFQPELGLTQAASSTPADALTLLAQELRENIEKFEHRLEVVEVDEEYDDEGRPYLEVICRMKSAPEQSFRLVADAGRRFLNIDLQEAETAADDD